MRTNPAALPLSLIATVTLLAACTSSGSSGTAAEAVSSTAAPSGRTGTSTATAVPEVITPVLGSVQDSPVPVTGTDGRVYLAYELYLTNGSSTPVTIDSVRAVNADGGATVQEFSGPELLAHSRVIGAAPAPSSAPTSVTLQGGQLGVIWLDPSADDGQSLPTLIDHVVTLTFAEAPNPLVPADYTETIARTSVSTVPAAVIKSPLNGPNWLNGNGCCSAVTPHRGAINPINGRYDLAERFAIDWVQLTADDRIYTGDITQLSSFAYYGAPIFAVADGEVVAVYDDLPDEKPGANPEAGKLQIAQFGGNYVVQKFEQNGDDYFAFYAHLKPGTATAAVQVGQQIKAGEQIGELGNSGNSDAPHLHFHVMDGPNPLAGNGLPYVFESLTMVGRSAGPGALDAAATQGVPLELAADGPTGVRTDALPLWMDVVDLTAGS
jgi:hypothetical protein